MSEQSTRSVTPDERLNDGALAAVRHIIREILIYRVHIRTTFSQDFRNQYHGTVFGVFWNIVLPLAPILLYALLARFRVLPAFEGVDPSSYVALGVTVWFFLAGCVQQPLMVVRSKNSEVMKTALPLSAMVLAGFGQLAFETLVRIAFVVVVIAITATRFEPTALLLPVVLIPATLFFLGLGLIAGIVNLIYGDVGRVIGIALQYGIFVSGVIFPIEIFPFSNILEWNPFYFFVETARILVFRGALEDWVPLTGFTLLSMGVFVLGCRIFYIMEYRVRGLT